MVEHRVALRTLIALGGVSLAGALPLAASAATSPAPPTPQPSIGCSGGLTRAPTVDEPNTLAYDFLCSGEIKAYTVIVNRRPRDFTTIDDFSAGAQVTDSTGYAFPTESFSCQGTIPGAGFNCLGDAKVGHAVGGTFDTTDPFCGGVLPGSRKGAAPLPAAIAQLVVTDASGGQDGPFRLNLAPACPKPKPVVKPKPKPKHKPKRRGSHGHSRGGAK